MKKREKSDLVVRVQWADDPARAEAALALLQQGFHRGLVKLAAGRKSNQAKLDEF